MDVFNKQFPLDHKYKNKSINSIPKKVDFILHFDMKLLLGQNAKNEDVGATAGSCLRSVIHKA